MKMQKRSFLVSGLSAIFLSAALVSSASAQVPSTTSLADRIVAAKSKAYHERLAAEFDKQADTDKAASERHRKMAQAYTTAPWAKASGTGMVAHCKSLVADYQKAAKQNSDMAKMHRDIGAKLP